jgi:polyisoprenoid-binding protein YceI
MPAEQTEIDNANALPDPGPDESISGSWRIDPGRSSVEFRVGTFWGLVTVKGHFDEYQGRLDLSADPAIDLTIEGASLQTRNRKRDKHLRSDDFFDVENHPQVRFVADSVDLHADALTVRGRLSAAGRSIPLTADAHLRKVEDELEIEATASAPHPELGMTYSPLGMIARRSRLRVTGRLTPWTDVP